MEIKNLKIYKITIEDERVPNNEFYTAVETEMRHVSEELDYPVAAVCTREGEAATIELITPEEKLVPYIKERFEKLYHVKKFTVELPVIGRIQSN